MSPDGSPQVNHKSYLKFHLGDYSALLPTYYVLDALTVSSTSITPTPTMPPTMLGLLNHQGKVFWVNDLALLMGLSTDHGNSPSCNLIVLQFNHVLLGLRIQAIGEVVKIPPGQLCAVPMQIPAKLLPFLQGCFQHDNEVLLLLNAKSVLQAPILRPC